MTSIDIKIDKAFIQLIRLVSFFFFNSISMLVIEHFHALFFRNAYGNVVIYKILLLGITTLLYQLQPIDQRTI